MNFKFIVLGIFMMIVNIVFWCAAIVAVTTVGYFTWNYLINNFI